MGDSELVADVDALVFSSFAFRVAIILAASAKMNHLVFLWIQS